MTGRTGKTDPKKVSRAFRRAQAVRMRAEGHTYEQIGEALGINRHSAYKIVARAIDEARETEAEDTAFLRDVQNARIEDMVRRIAEGMKERPRAIPGTGTIPPTISTLEAAQALVKLLERQAKLNGLDAPQKVALGAPGRPRLGPDGRPEPDDPHAFRAIAILPSPHEDPDAWAAEYGPTTIKPAS